MPRPKKPDAEKRDNRLTVYLTDQERDTLYRVAELQGRAMTQVVIVAVKEWIQRLMNPPEPLSQARHEQIMSQQSEMLRGYICKNGHSFWIEWVTPTPPRCCPICGTEREMKRTWDGTIRREL